MDAVKFVNCEQIHLKVWFKRSTMYTYSIKSVKRDQFDRSIWWLQIAMQTSIKRWYIGHGVFFPFDTTTIHFSLVWIFLVNHFCSFTCAMRPIYTTFKTNIVFNINICRFSSSRPAFYINNMFGEEWFNSNEMATSFRNSIWRQPPSFQTQQLQSTSNLPHPHQVWLELVTW